MYKRDYSILSVAMDSSLSSLEGGVFSVNDDTSYELQSVSLSLPKNLTTSILQNINLDISINLEEINIRLQSYYLKAIRFLLQQTSMKLKDIDIIAITEQVLPNTNLDIKAIGNALNYHKFYYRNSDILLESKDDLLFTIKKIFNSVNIPFVVLDLNGISRAFYFSQTNNYIKDLGPGNFLLKNALSCFTEQNFADKEINKIGLLDYKYIFTKTDKQVLEWLISDSFFSTQKTDDKFNNIAKFNNISIYDPVWYAMKDIAIYATLLEFILYPILMYLREIPKDTRIILSLKGDNHILVKGLKLGLIHPDISMTENYDINGDTLMAHIFALLAKDSITKNNTMNQ